MFSVFRSFWEPNVRRIEPAWPATDDMAEYRLPSETAREKKKTERREGEQWVEKEKVQRGRKRY